MKKSWKIGPNAIIGAKSLRDIPEKKAMIGENAIFLGNSVVYESTIIGDNLIIGHNSVIREENKIGNNFKLWNNSVIDYGCRIGNNVKVHCNCYVAQNSVIEDNAFLAPGVIIANDRYPGSPNPRLVGATIKRGAQIGINATILPGIVIGERALIGAGSVVTKNVPKETVFAGNPARKVCSIFDIKDNGRQVYK